MLGLLEVASAEADLGGVRRKAQEVLDGAEGLVVDPLLRRVALVAGVHGHGAIRVDAPRGRQAHAGPQALYRHVHHRRRGRRRRRRGCGRGGIRGRLHLRGLRGRKQGRGVGAIPERRLAAEGALGVDPVGEASQRSEEAPRVPLEGDGRRVVPLARPVQPPPRLVDGRRLRLLEDAALRHDDLAVDHAVDDLLQLQRLCLAVDPERAHVRARVVARHVAIGAIDDVQVQTVLLPEVLGDLSVGELHDDVAHPIRLDGVVRAREHGQAVALVHGLQLHQARVHAQGRRAGLGRDVVARPAQRHVPSAHVAPEVQAADRLFASDAAVPNPLLPLATQLLEAVEVPAHHRPKAAERVVLREEDRLHEPEVRGVDSELDFLLPGDEPRPVDALEDVLHGAWAAGATQAAMLAGVQRRVADGAADEGAVGEAESERARGAVDLQPAKGVGGVVDEGAVDDVVGHAVSEILRRLPVHRVCVVDADVAREGDIAQGVLADEHVVPLIGVLDHIRRDHAVVRAVLLELLAARYDHAVLVANEVPGKLVVQINAVALAVMVDVALELPERSELWADLAPSVALPIRVGGARGVDAVLVARDAIVQEVVGHADHVDARSLDAGLAQPRHSANRPMRAYHDVVADDVVHLVAILDEDPGRAHVPHDVLVDDAAVRAVDGDANLLRVDDGVAGEGALGTRTHQVPMQAVLPHLVAPPAVLDSRVGDRHHALVHHHGRQAFLALLEVVVVAHDDDGTLQVHHLRGHLETLACDLAEPTEVLGRQGRVHDDYARQDDADHPAEHLHFLKPQA
mmetsp:Transcript_66338/g.192201  ORF Transcript_66338/g.192201 Transcript_66338/m.192201 type:complete len:799 (-) Transcript_66338:57-2453(-)